MRVATIDPGERIMVTPLWFGWAGGEVCFFGCGQKIANLRRNPVCTVLVDRNERYPELAGAMFQGHAAVLEDAAAEDAGPHLEDVRRHMGAKYAGGHGETPVIAVFSTAVAARPAASTMRWGVGVSLTAVPMPGQP
jgi:nitroimidazol reductase NimA-like FMN-containing flavoprotein (pyridoxamine 5'-phosphate oxidase superfamily)